jgi:CBS domain containing-hemolysin-like protein/mannitol/fructose-specific phosphotransferase system IIA component (Ntr-type)
MQVIILGLSLVFLLTLNAFFVLAEFAIVKVRPSRVVELVSEGHPQATILQQVQSKLDEYLSVCQVGITLASVALGMVGNLATEAMLDKQHPSTWRLALAMTVSYLVVSGSHIVLGELVPKSISIRIADRAALYCAVPLRFFRNLFWPALIVLNQLTALVLRLIGMRQATDEETHTEEELRIILEHSQEHGLMSFRRLLFMENVFDFGELVVRDAMRSRSVVRCLEAALSWEDNFQIVRSSRFTRYPLITTDPERPTGFVHLKDLILRASGDAPDWPSLVRPILTTTESTPLEALLADMQRKRNHAAIVLNGEGRWSGFITLEDIIEELVGTIRDEFEDEEPLRLADTLTIERIFLDVEAPSPIIAVHRALRALPKQLLPLPPEQLMTALETRERLVGTYLGQGIAMPHARLTKLTRPFLMILRSLKGVPCEGTSELAHLMFVLLTPAGQPRVHLRLQSTIAALLHESEFVKDRLMNAETREQVLEAIRTGEQAALG